MAKAAHQGYPRGMDDAPQAIGSPELKDPAGQKLINKLTKPRNPSKKNPARYWTPETAPKDFARLYAYCEQDIRTESAASIRVPDLSQRELGIWRVDQRINRRGMYMDRPGIDDCISIVEQCIQRGNGELRVITNGQVQAVSKAADMMRWLQARGVFVTELDEEAVEEQLERLKGVSDRDPVKRVLLLRQTLSFGSVKKLYAMRYQTADDGRLRDQYAYSAAHTRLWNGQNVQMANLFSPTMFKTPEDIDRALAVIASRSLDYVEGVYGVGTGLEVVANCLRSMVIAPPGYDLIGADYSAIQAVVTSCLSGEPWRIKVFCTHGKIYEEQASRMTGKPFQFYLDYRKETGKHHPDRQDWGKLPVLSGDFGAWIGGWKRFGADKILGEDKNIKQAILKLRASIPWVVELWGGQTRNKFGRDLHGNRANEYPEPYGLEGAAVSAVLTPGKTYGYRGVRYLYVLNDHCDALFCQPPTNGDPLIYHEPRLEPSRREYASPWELRLSYMGWNSNQAKGKGGWVRMDLYGGLATQNVVANMSREVQADSLVRLEHTELYKPVQHTHDDKIVEVPEGQGSIEEFLQINNILPDWARFPDGTPWPIRAPAAERTKRVGKWE